MVKFLRVAIILWDLRFFQVYTEGWPNYKEHKLDCQKIWEFSRYLNGFLILNIHISVIEELGQSQL